MRLGLVQAHLAKGEKMPFKGGKKLKKGGKIDKMFMRKKKKTDEYSVIVYKEDLSIDLGRLLLSDKSDGLKEFFYVPHNDTPKEHYHIYLKFDKRVTEEVVNKLFYKSKCFISPVRSHETSLSLLCYFTENLRLPFESNYSIDTSNLRRINK